MYHKNIGREFMIYFGTDGIRGVAIQDITQEICLKCGNAVGSLKSKAKIIVGTDTRVSASFMLTSFASGATLAGADIYFVGVVPTPAISFLVKKHKADFGVMITASHNPPEYNGIKVFNSKGEKIETDLQIEIERRFAKQTICQNMEVGKFVFKPRYINEYIDFVCETGIRLNGLKVVLDSANGASTRTASKIFKKLGAEVIKIGTSLDGKEINNNCGALFPQKVSSIVKKTGADIGFAFDGDADRIVLVDEKGNICDGDQILLFLTKMYIKYGLLKTGAIVSTIQTNIAIENEIEKLGLRLVRTDVGDKFVCEELAKKQLQIGGEQSGHIILTDYENTGDGVLCAVQICKFLKITGEKISQNLFFDLTKQHSKDVMLKDKYGVINSAKFKIAVSECEHLLNGKGRIVTRASGTEPKIRIMVETQDETLAGEILTRLFEATK